ncbi:hypothetical protein [Paenibacillus sp. N3.4]|uniref:hypothetical protein n=1 Tax=Paenibacillus sp. N3.4 TaxID=2603222 RepID=UPI0011CB308E|nr:hypothetical protein [Paenibacillus sp. N3.4]TXK80028.1 hypothetical protein FU659_18840 [Paenibacillus sp. N3.4]
MLSISPTPTRATDSAVHAKSPLSKTPINDKYPLQVVVKDTVLSFIDSLKPSMQIDANDAIVACITMASAIEKLQIDASWTVKPTFAFDEE